MEHLIEKLNAATAPGPHRAAAGLVIATATSKGDPFIRAFGTTTVHGDAPPVTPSSVMWLASATKLVTTVAAMQCVERGLFALDDPISIVLPAWSHPEVLVGFSDESNGEPMVRGAKKSITLRHLLTHTSGIAIEQGHPPLARWKAWKKGAPTGGHTQTVDEGGDILELMVAGFTDSTDELGVPLVYEPGDGWSYGGNLDVASRMIEKATGFATLEEYMVEHIWKPLDLHSTTFHPAKRPDINVLPMTVKLPNGELSSDIPLPFPNQDPQRPYGGGSGLFSTAEDFLKLLSSLLLNDGKVLEPGTVDLMLKPQLSTNDSLMANLAIPEFAQYMVPGMPTDRVWNWGLGGILATNGIPNRAGENCMWWGGAANAQWWIDREVGSCGLLLTHMIPPGDERTSVLFGELQQALFAKQRG